MALGRLGSGWVGRYDIAATIFRPISRPTPWPVEAKRATARRSVALRRKGYSALAAHKPTQLAFCLALTQIPASLFDGADGRRISDRTLVRYVTGMRVGD